VDTEELSNQQRSGVSLYVIIVITLLILCPTERPQNYAQRPPSDCHVCKIAIIYEQEKEILPPDGAQNVKYCIEKMPKNLGKC